MPYDGKDFTLPTIDPVLKPGLDGLAQLSHALRHPELWPTHEWDFITTCIETDCGSVGCALGLARQLWPQQFCCGHGDTMGLFSVAQRVFGLSPAEESNIFDTDGYDDPPSVTPAMVADAIDALLAEMTWGLTW